MAIKINWNDLQKRFIGTTEIVRVYKSGVQVRPETLSDDYLCFELANGSWGTVTLNTYGTPTEVSLEYSYDKSTWTDYTIWDSISLTTWQKIYMRNKSTTPTWFSIYTGEDYRFLFEGNISASWDITYLLCKYGTTTLTSSYCFVNLFAGCTSLITAPSLPATTLTDNCYTQMFYGCTGLTTAPSLPATTLADWCYRVMFRGCTSLTTVPSLPATTLASWCYALMFQGCSNLTTLPSLPVTTLESYCYRDMFRDCSKIKLSSTQTWEYQTPYRIPTTWTWAIGYVSMTDMFTNTWWTFTGTPSINTTYYTSNTVI